MSLPVTLLPETLEIRLRDMPMPWSWSDIFGDDRPVEVEIGTGNGTFLVDAAMRSPEHGFLGIEVSKKFFTKALRRAARQEAVNVRMVLANAAYVLTKYVPPASVAAYYIYFPEPWPKDRHAKRRLFQPGLVASLAETLQPGGHILVATDVAEYFETMASLVAAEGRLERLKGRDPLLASARGRVATSYEKKYQAAGRPIRYAVWRRHPLAQGEGDVPRAVAPAELPKEEPMPHVVVERPLALRDYVERFEPLVHKEGDTVSKASEAYLSRSGSSALLKAVVVDDGQTQRFFILLSEKPEQVTVKLLRMTDPDKTRGVKQLLALVAKDLVDHSAGAAYGATNIEPFLFRS